MPILTAVGSTTTALCTLTAFEAIEAIDVMLFMLDMGALGGCWVTAIGLVLVIVVIVAAGIIRVDILDLIKAAKLCSLAAACVLRSSGNSGKTAERAGLPRKEFGNHLFFQRKGSALPKKMEGGERTLLKVLFLRLVRLGLAQSWQAHFRES